MTWYGNGGDDNRITGLEYCTIDGTWVISGYGDDVTPELLSKLFVAKINGQTGAVIDVYLYTSTSATIYTYDMAYHFLNNTDWFFVAFTIGDQLLGTQQDVGVLKVNYTI